MWTPCGDSLTLASALARAPKREVRKRSRSCATLPRDIELKPISNPKPAIKATSASTTKSSMRVNPLARQTLSDCINRRYNRDRDKPEQDSHHYHKDRLDGGREIFCLFVHFGFVELGQIGECCGEVAGCFADCNHMGQHIGKKLRLALQGARDLLPFGDRVPHARIGSLVKQVRGSLGSYNESLGQVHTAP